MQRIGKPEPSDDIRLIFIIKNFGCSRDNLFFFLERVYFLPSNKHSCLDIKCKYIKVL